MNDTTREPERSSNRGLVIPCVHRDRSSCGPGPDESAHAERGTLQAIAPARRRGPELRGSGPSRFHRQGHQELANQGNQNAKTIVAELQKRGITINVPAPAAPAQK
jgi:hypothetical protein